MSDEATPATEPKPVATTADRVAGICRDTPAVIKRTLQDVRIHGSAGQHGKIIRELKEALRQHEEKQIADAVELLKEIAPDRLALGETTGTTTPVTPVARVTR